MAFRGRRVAVEIGNIGLDVEQGGVIENIHGRCADQEVFDAIDPDNVKADLVDAVG